MPQITLEYSKNLDVVSAEMLSSIILKCHKTIAEYLDKNNPNYIQACKSRIIGHDAFCIGAGEKNKAFIHLQVAVLPGRDNDLLNIIGNSLLQHLHEAFVPLIGKLNTQITVEVKELSAHYFKAEIK